jgi:hypothetical protein
MALLLRRPDLGRVAAALRDEVVDVELPYPHTLAYCSSNSRLQRFAKLQKVRWEMGGEEGDEGVPAGERVPLSPSFLSGVRLGGDIP